MQTQKNEQDLKLSNFEREVIQLNLSNKNLNSQIEQSQHTLTTRDQWHQKTIEELQGKLNHERSMLSDEKSKVQDIEMKLQQALTKAKTDQLLVSQSEDKILFQKQITQKAT